MEPKSDTHGEKHRKSIIEDAKEVDQSMTFVYMNHKKNLKMEKSCQIDVAGFRVWFGHFFG